MEEKKKLPLWSKIIIWVIGSIVGLFVLVWGGLNIFKYAIYADYYGCMTSLGSTPGLNDGFIPQGICVSEENDVYIMSGYVSKNPSQIYITGGDANKEFETKKFDLYRNGKAFTGHVGGIATTGDKVYLASSSKIFVLDLTHMLETNETDLDIGDGIEVYTNSSYVFTNDDYLYVGEFHDGGAYITEHEYDTRDGKYYAVVEKYNLSDIRDNTGADPVEVISIRNNVQGFAVSDNNEYYLSTSYGLTSSIYYKYPSSSLSSSSYTFEDDIPVKLLDGEYTTLTGPAMSEDLDYSNGKIISYTESACNKYIFGKFFFAYYFFGLDF